MRWDVGKSGKKDVMTDTRMTPDNSYKLKIVTVDNDGNERNCTSEFFTIENNEDNSDNDLPNKPDMVYMRKKRKNW